MTSSRHFAVGVAVVRMRRRGVAGKVDTDDAQPDLAAPRARRAEVLPNEGATTHGHPPGRSTLGIISWGEDGLAGQPGSGGRPAPFRNVAGPHPARPGRASAGLPADLAVAARPGRSRAAGR